MYGVLKYFFAFSEKPFTFVAFLPSVSVQFLRKLHTPNWIRNKYVLVALVAGLWILFFDRNSIVSQVSMRNHIAKIKADKEFYQKGISELDYKIELMNTDLHEVEKYAREQYWLKRKSEDLFIVEEE